MLRLTAGEAAEMLDRIHQKYAIAQRDYPGQDGTAKELFWVDGTTRRWDGYLYFQRHPHHILDWIARHTKS